MDVSDDGIHITLPRSILITLGLAVAAAGTGTGLSLGPQIEKSALQQCFDSSQMALQVAADHGTEIKNLESLILERTRDLWTEDDHKAYERSHEKEHELIEKRLKFLESR